MEQLLLWALLVAASWRHVPGVELMEDPPQLLYPALEEEVTLSCDCGGQLCEQVTWFRMLLPSATLQMLGRLNQADRATYGDGLEGVVRVSKRTRSEYMLRILRTSLWDRGVYSCVLKVREKDGNISELWRTGTLVLPGESPPTEAPQGTPRAPTPPDCPCPTQPQAPGAVVCGGLVLWPLVGLTCALSLTLTCTLLYYRRLPKKCRHRFVRKK